MTNKTNAEPKTVVPNTVIFNGKQYEQTVDKTGRPCLARNSRGKIIAGIILISVSLIVVIVGTMLYFDMRTYLDKPSGTCTDADMSGCNAAFAKIFLVFFLVAIQSTGLWIVMVIPLLAMIIIGIVLVAKHREVLYGPQDKPEK